MCSQRATDGRRRIGGEATSRPALRIDTICHYNGMVSATNPQDSSSADPTAYNEYQCSHFTDYTTYLPTFEAAVRLGQELLTLSHHSIEEGCNNALLLEERREAKFTPIPVFPVGVEIQQARQRPLVGRAGVVVV